MTSTPSSSFKGTFSSFSAFPLLAASIHLIPPTLHFIFHLRQLFSFFAIFAHTPVFSLRFRRFSSSSPRLVAHISFLFPPFFFTRFSPAIFFSVLFLLSILFPPFPIDFVFPFTVVFDFSRLVSNLLCRGL